MRGGGLDKARNAEGRTLNTGHISPARHLCQSQKLPEGGSELTSEFLLKAQGALLSSSLRRH